MSHYNELLDKSLDDLLNDILIAPNQHAELMPSLHCLEQIAKKVSSAEIKSLLVTLQKNIATI